LDPHRVQELVQRSRADNGFLVKSPGAAGPANYLQFASQDYDIDDAPSLEIVWDERVGEKPEYTFERQRLSDRTGLEVNVAAGNLRVTNTDQQIAGTGLDHVIARSYDSLAVWPDGAAGRYWSMSTAPDVRLDLYGDGSAGFVGPAGAPLAFHKTGANQWRPPPGVHATLVTEGSGYKLTFRDSLEVWRFDSAGRAVEHEDRNGNAIAFDYDGSGLLESATDTQGRETTFDFDGDGRIEEIVDSAGRHHYYDHDGEMLESYTDPAGETTYYEYSGILLSEITDPRGNRTLLDYDSAGRVEEIVRVTDDYAGTGPTWSFDYHTGDPRCPASTRSNEMEDPRGNETVWCHDTSYRVVKTIDANGNQREATWSPTNTPLSSTAPGSAQTTMGYDSLDNLESVDEPAGENTALSYGHAQHERFPTEITSPQGTGSVFAYDGAGNTTTIGDSSSPASQVEAKLEYNGQAGGSCPDDPTTKPGTLRCAIDGKGNETLYGYDDDGNLTSVTPELPLGDTTIAYDSLSRVDTVEDGKGQTRSYSYDELDRVTEIDYGAGGTVSFDYDANGNQVERIDSVHGTSTWTYDELNRRVEDDLPSGDTDYSWDAAGNLTSLTDAGGTVTYRYDDVNRLADLAEPGGSCTSPVSLCTTFGYTSRDQRERTTYPNGVEQTITFDSSDKPTRVRAVKGATVLTDLTYDYDEASPGTLKTKLRRSVTDKDGNETTYGYDFLDRLTAAVERNSSNVVIDSRHYAYDLASNRTGQLINGSGTTFRYNAANQLCWQYVGSSSAACGSPPSGATTYSYDANGNTTGTSAGVDFDYNVRDQTTAFTAPGGSPISFGYAGAGQSERASRAGTAQHNTLLGLSREGTTSWTRDPGGTLISQRASGGVRHYYLADSLGSVVGLTDSVGVLTRSYKYDPYGILRSTTGSTPNPFMYTSQYAEAGGALYKIGARYYGPGLGRWTQQDPLDQVGELREGNRYAYVGADPINLIDPTGTISLGDIGDIIKGVGKLLTAATVVYCASRGTIAGWEASGNTNKKSAIKASLTGPYAFFKEGYECAKPPFL
jgi:RHS repeat-associated protein